VILINRPDAYDRDSPRSGEAELILAKHRNGPIKPARSRRPLHMASFGTSRVAIKAAPGVGNGHHPTTPRRRQKSRARQNDQGCRVLVRERRRVQPGGASRVVTRWVIEEVEGDLLRARRAAQRIVA
jgi:DnaB-like helicase C terminal domain